MEIEDLGGRNTLVCNVLGSLGNFLFSLFPAPKRIIKTLEGIRRDFFRGGEEYNRKIPWVKWETVLLEKKRGGLGITPSEDLNRALIAKWYWRFCIEDRALWRKIIVSIHGSNNTNSEGRIKSGTTWRRIVQCWNQLQDLNLDPRMIIKRSIGNGKQTKF